MKNLFLLSLLCSLLRSTSSELYDVMNSSVQRLNKSNFAAIVTKGAQKENISLVHFYSPNDGQSYQFSGKFQEMADKLKGIMTLAFVNCKENAQLCKAETGDKLPMLVLYPPFPFSKEAFELDVNVAVNKGLRHIQNYVTVQTDESLLAFVKTEAQLPKVLFFNEGERVPIYLQALSKSFNGKLQFGMFNKQQQGAIQKYRVTKFPAVRVFVDDTQPFKSYDGEFKYQPLFDFLNIFSQQFVPEKVGKGAQEKPWLFQEFPEMTDKSHKDICTQGEKIICFLLFVEGEISPR